MEGWSLDTALQRGGMTVAVTGEQDRNIHVPQETTAAVGAAARLSLGTGVAVLCFVPG